MRWHRSARAGRARTDLMHLNCEQNLCASAEAGGWISATSGGWGGGWQAGRTHAPRLLLALSLAWLFLRLLSRWLLPTGSGSCRLALAACWLSLVRTPLVGLALCLLPDHIAWHWLTLACATEPPVLLVTTLVLVDFIVGSGTCGHLQSPASSSQTTDCQRQVLWAG